MTTSERQRTNLVSVAAGICIVGLGILLLLQTNGIIGSQEILKFWPVALILIGGAVTLQSRPGAPTAAGMPIGGSVWIVLFGLLFSHVYERRGNPAGPVAEGQVDIFAVMAGDRSRQVTREFNGGRITVLMGGTRLDLRKAQLDPGEVAEIDVFTVMGGGEVYVPEHWVVDIQAVSIMAGIKDQRSRGSSADKDGKAEPARLPPSADDISDAASPGTPDLAIADAAPPRLVVRGVVLMGGLTIKP